MHSEVNPFCERDENEIIIKANVHIRYGAAEEAGYVDGNNYHRRSSQKNAKQCRIEKVWGCKIICHSTVFGIIKSLFLMQSISSNQRLEHVTHGEENWNLRVDKVEFDREKTRKLNWIIRSSCSALKDAPVALVYSNLFRKCKFCNKVDRKFKLRNRVKGTSEWTSVSKLKGERFF